MPNKICSSRVRPALSCCAWMKVSTAASKSTSLFSSSLFTRFSIPSHLISWCAISPLSHSHISRVVYVRPLSLTVYIYNYSDVYSPRASPRVPPRQPSSRTCIFHIPCPSRWIVVIVVLPLFPLLFSLSSIVCSVVTRLWLFSVLVCFPFPSLGATRFASI